MSRLPGRNWREYLMEAAALGIFMISANAFAALLGHPASPVPDAIPDGNVRRVLMGLAMGATAAALIYSPWGRRSGAHMNPATTLAFLRLGRVAPADAAAYAVAHVAGGIAGALLASAALGELAAHPAVAHVATRPGPGGEAAAFAAEAAISFILLSTVLHFSASPRRERFAGLAAASLVTLFIAVEEPLSGMSMNPARSLASAVAAGRFEGLWIYFLAPPLGMILAVEARRLLGGAFGCAKYRHDVRHGCLFCAESERRRRMAAHDASDRDSAAADPAGRGVRAGPGIRAPAAGAAATPGGRGL